MERHHGLIKKTGQAQPRQVLTETRLTGGAVDAADAVRVVQVATVQLSVETKFGELPGLPYSFQLAVGFVRTLQDGLVFMSFVVTLEV